MLTCSQLSLLIISKDFSWPHCFHVHAVARLFVQSHFSLCVLPCQSNLPGVLRINGAIRYDLAMTWLDDISIFSVLWSGGAKLVLANFCWQNTSAHINNSITSISGEYWNGLCLSHVIRVKESWVKYWLRYAPGDARVMLLHVFWEVIMVSLIATWWRY